MWLFSPSVHPTPERLIFVVQLIYAFIGWPFYVLWPGIKPAILAYWDDALTTWVTWPGQQLILYKISPMQVVASGDLTKLTFPNFALHPVPPIWDSDLILAKDHLSIPDLGASQDLMVPCFTMLFCLGHRFGSPCSHTCTSGITLGWSLEQSVHHPPKGGLWVLYFCRKYKTQSKPISKKFPKIKTMFFCVCVCVFFSWKQVGQYDMVENK